MMSSSGDMDMHSTARAPSPQSPVTTGLSHTWDGWLLNGEAAYAALALVTLKIPAAMA